MDNLLHYEPICYAKRRMDCVEECGYNGEYTLPEYCPDVAVVLKCIAEPRLQSRQYTGNSLLLDGMVNLRVIYLDEGRCRVHSVEFSLPYSCTLRGEEECDNEPAFFDLSTKYVNCRATSPRRLEVYGVVQVAVEVYGNFEAQRAASGETEGLYTRSVKERTSRLVGHAEKVVALNESLEFPESLPAAEMLLGGTCTARIKEWKVLTGKVIARGALTIHQLYMDCEEPGNMHCLDYEVPFSQILDVTGVQEGHLCCGDVRILMNTESCGVGPDGENTLLEIIVKMLFQLRVYATEETPLLLEAFHTHHPVEQEWEEMTFTTFCGSHNEQTVLPMQIKQPQEWREIIDLWVQPTHTATMVENETTMIVGGLQVSVLGKNKEGEIEYFEKTEEYRLEYPCVGNKIDAKVCITDLRYRGVDGNLEIQAGLSVWLYQYRTTQQKVVRTLRLNSEQCYPRTKASALLYYAQPGESIWSIARDCHTSPDMIHTENQTDEEILTDACVLLVPMA